MIRRNSSTIPFGYKLSEDNKTLEKVDKELSSLAEMKDGVKSGAFSLRGAVEILEHQTGRKLSAMGLKKIIDRDGFEKPKGLMSRNDKSI
jgi:Asp-tRNA(Asn)/Glu-tRNA(Gln) amidotransferase B subunit